MPVGVEVSVSTIPGPGTIDLSPGSAYFAVGQSQRGNPNQAVLVESLSEFASLFGPRVAYSWLWDDLAAFFGEGGTHAYVARTVGPAATAGTITLNDTAGTPLPTLKLTAGAPATDPDTGQSIGNVADPGAWSANVTVQVVASVLTGQWTLLVFNGGVQAEQWGPFPDVATAVTRINAASSYLMATNLFSASVGALANPAVQGTPVALSAGSDDRASITVTQYTAALALFLPGYGSGAVAVPGQDASIAGTALLAHAAANGRVALLSPTEGMSESSVRSAAAAFRGTANSKNGGYSWPWVQIPDGAGGTRIVPPDGFVAGLRSRTVAADGPWQAPAGNWGTARYVVGLDPASGTVTDAVGDSLNDDHVNVIRPKSGIRLYGWRSLSTDTVNYDLLSQADTLNWLAFALGQQMQQYDFAVIDSNGQLFSQMRNTARNVLDPLITAGALYAGPPGSNGAPSDPGYLLDTGPSVNTPALLAENQAAIAVYVRLSPTATLIPVTLVKVPVGTAF